MPLSCFCAARNGAIETDQPPTPLPPRRVNAARPKKASFRRPGASTPSSRTSSNGSISLLPPCTYRSDPRLEAMMMPLPVEARPSRCLRLSHPKIYGSLVSDMKLTKGCRDWRTFDVFDGEDIDANVSAVDYAKKRALESERRVAQSASFNRHKLDGVDMIA